LETKVKKADVNEELREFREDIDLKDWFTGPAGNKLYKYIFT